MGSILDRDRIRFSCFRYASDEILTVPWRGATGYFCNKGGLRKMAYPLSTRSRFDAKSGSTEKIKPGQTWKRAHLRASDIAERIHKVVADALRYRLRRDRVPPLRVRLGGCKRRAL